VTLGSQTGAVIELQTLLGEKDLALIPRGSGQLGAGAEIPVSRTVPPYDVTAALAQLTTQVSDTNVSQLSTALDTLSTTLRAAGPQLGPALQGVLRLSQAVNARDTELTQLLAHTAGVSTVLASRDQQVTALFQDGAVLFEALNARSAAISQLLANARAVFAQLSGLAAENAATIGPDLASLNSVLALLEKNKANLDAALNQASPLIRELGEVLSSVPGFDLYIPNLVDTGLVPGLPLRASGGTK
jgi:phospholipid/cholesterol/gamma-HCH transport system substrate-binding protein